MFFDVCVKCKQTFNDESEFRKHMEIHKKFCEKRKITSEETVGDDENSGQAQFSAGMTEQESSERIEKMKEVTTKRKRLINAGVEAQTMKPEEVEKRYEYEKKNGKVR